MVLFLPFLLTLVVVFIFAISFVINKNPTSSSEPVSLFVVPETFNVTQAHNTIDAVVYINLAERNDRKLHIEKELEKLSGIYKTKERIDAVKHEVGAKGCALSHIKALKRAKTKGWKNVLIVEDDLTFNEDNASLLIAYVTQSRDFDVLLIAGNIKSSSKKETLGLAKALKVQTTACYLARAHYYDILIENFVESNKNLKSKQKQKTWAIDKNWFKLQGRDNWLLFEPTLARQRPDYSDIEKKKVNYGV